MEAFSDNREVQKRFEESGSNATSNHSGDLNMCKYVLIIVRTIHFLLVRVPKLLKNLDISSMERD